MALSRHCEGVIFLLLYTREVMILNITQFIKSHKELNELPFLVFSRTMQVLREMGMLKGFDDVDRVQS